MATSFGFEQFARRMRVIAAKFGANSAELVRRAAIVADQTVVLATPVDTGRARANWRAAIGAPVLTATNDVDQAGGATIAEGQAVIGQWKLGDGPIYISNNVPYIVPLDEGSSAQAPSGMTSLAIQAARAVLSNPQTLRDL